MLLVTDIREGHPTIGLRDLYYKLMPSGVGRDKFEQLCKNVGLSKERAINYQRTTNSNGVVRFDNLLDDLEINKVNQVWQSDITYFLTEYLTNWERRAARWVRGVALASS